MRVLAAVLLLALGGSDMPKRSPDRGVQPFELRPGADFKRLRGMNRSADPASIPDDQFHLLTNVRLTPAGMTDRPGLLYPEHEAESAGCITGMVEIDEVGVGLWLTPSGGSATYPGSMQLGNLNEQKVGTVDLGPFPGRSAQLAEFRRYNDELLDDSPDNPGSLEAAVTYPAPRIGYHRDEPAVSLIKYRKKLLQLGWRYQLNPEDPNEIDASTWQQWVCLWEIELPEDDEAPIVDYQLYQDLWRIEGATSTERLRYEVRDMVAVFGRSDDPLTGEEGVAEHLFISRGDGKVFDFDGTTVQESVDAGGNYALRLAVVNEIGVLAVGSDEAVPPAATVARYLNGVGGSWSSPTVPAGIQVNDLFAYAGAVYITSDIPSGSGWAGARIYRSLGGGNITQIHELAGTSEAGLFFSRAGGLYLVAQHPAAPVGYYYIYQRSSDSVWFQYPNDINWFQDFGADVRWVLVTAKGRTLFGGYWEEKNIGQGGTPGSPNGKEIVAEVDNWSKLGGNTMKTVYFNPTPLEVNPGVGNQAVMVGPEDTTLNEEEL